MELTLEEARKRMRENNGNLDLSGTQITRLPEGLKLGGEVIGADIDPEQVKRAKQRYAEAFGEA